MPMCGRITLRVTADELQSSFGFVAPAGYRPRYNIAPSQNLLALAEGGLRTFHWGLIPFWADQPSIGSRMINARAETVAEKPAFRAAFSRRRCLVLADGFFERKQDQGHKRPHLIRLRSGRPFTLAGLWERWARDGREIESCAILTTSPNELVAPVHDRMPVIIGEADRSRWIDAATTREDARQMLLPFAAGEMELYEVSTLVNSPANDLPECVEPLVAEDPVVP
jgi:putative SOS response-associated peptidase YedK